MSSQVITTLPGQDPSEKETEIEPGKQKNFYRQISGAGDGLPLQTTAADFGAKNSIVKPEMEQDPDMEQQPEVPILAEQNGDNMEKQVEQNNQLEPDWQKKIRSLQDQVNIFR